MNNQSSLFYKCFSLVFSKTWNYKRMNMAVQLIREVLFTEEMVKMSLKIF